MFYTLFSDSAAPERRLRVFQTFGYCMFREDEWKMWPLMRQIIMTIVLEDDSLIHGCILKRIKNWGETERILHHVGGRRYIYGERSRKQNLERFHHFLSRPFSQTLCFTLLQFSLRHLLPLYANPIRIVRRSLETKLFLACIKII